MGWELDIAGRRVPNNRWSGPQGLRSGYRGAQPGEREFGAVNFTLFGDLTEAQPGWAITFGGTDEYAYVIKTGSPDLDAVMTVGFWMRRHTLAPINKGMIARGGNGGYGAFVIEEYGNGLLFLQSTSGTNWETWVISDDLLTTDWYCVLAMNLGVEAKFWINDAESGTPQAGPASGTLYDPKVDITLACQTEPASGTLGRFADIDVADVRIWNRALSFAERTAYYNGGRINPLTIGGDEWLWLKADEGSGDTLVGHSSNRRDGVNKGGLWIPCELRSREEQHSIIAENAVVTLGKGGQGRYRGVITGYTRDPRTLAVETMEAAAKLNDADAGMEAVGGLPNPLGYVYWDEGERFRIWREADVGPVYGRLNYNRDFLFDSYDYRAGGNLSWERSLLWKELPAETICGRVRDQINGVVPDLIRGTALALDGPSETTLVNAQTADGERVEAQWREANDTAWYRPFGVITRVIGGATITILWRRVDNDLILHQLVNHGLAVPLGRIPLSDGLGFVRSPGLYPDLHYGEPGNPGSSESGPWEAAIPGEWPWILGFYLIAGKFEGGEYLQRAYVYSIDLRNARDAGEDGLLEYQSYEISETFTDQFRKYVALTGPSGYHTQTTLVPLWNRNNSRTGGSYTDRGDGGQIYWQGQRWLSEFALDFRGAKLGNVLGEMARAAGCEWWIDYDGTLRMERMDRATRFSEVSPLQILRDPVQTRAAVTVYDDLTLSGIPMPKYTQELLRIGLKNAAATATKVRLTELRSRPGDDYGLGSKLVVNGQTLGRIVAMEPTLGTDKLEIEVGANDRQESLR